MYGQNKHETLWLNLAKRAILWFMRTTKYEFSNFVENPKREIRLKCKNFILSSCLFMGYTLKSTDYILYLPAQEHGHHEYGSWLLHYYSHVWTSPAINIQIFHIQKPLPNSVYNIYRMDVFPSVVIIISYD